MPLADSWHIKSRAHHCSVTEKPFTEGEAFYTALLPDPESDGYLRLDFSPAAWDARGEESEQPFSFWRTVYRPPEVEAKAREVEGVSDVKLDLVWEPPWDMEMMSPAARLQLNL